MALRVRAAARRGAVLLLFLLLAGSGLSVAACGTPESPDPLDLDNERAESSLGASEATFVGREACATCHDAETALWEGSHHDLAMQVADGQTVLGDFDGATLTHFGVTSTFSVRNGEFVVRTEGLDGTLQDYPVAYTFGVAPLQQYLVEFPGGRLQALSVAWDSRPADAGGQRWFHLYPDERITPDDPLHWTGPYQNWNFMCSECHSTDVAKNFNLETDSYDTTWSEIDVSCESCHGPASEHVAWALALAAGERPRSDDSNGIVLSLGDAVPAVWVFDLETGLAVRTPPRESRAEVEACARCHARRSVLSDDYVYGRPLMDSHRPALLDDPLYHPDGQISDEVYVYGSFIQSKMYAEGVTCKDCHDPHSLRVRGTGNSVCAGCHLPTMFDTPDHHFHEAGSAGASCVDCHMPAQRYMVVDPRRDHSMRVPRPDLSLTLGTPNACSACHTDQSVQWTADAVATWYGPDTSAQPHYGEAIHAGRTGQPGAGEALRRLADDPLTPGIARATALSLLEGHFTADAAPVVRRALGDDDPIVRAAAVSALEVILPAARLELAFPLLIDPVRAVRLQAARVLAAVPSEQLSGGQRATLARVLDEYRASQQASADRAEAHLNLGVLHTQLGELDEAERAYRTALDVDPSFVPTYLNLADLYRQRGRDVEGEAFLREALAIAADPAPVEHALGLLLVRQGRLSDALPALQRATQLRPDLPRYAYVYGVALQSSGEISASLAVLADAHARHPEDRDLLIALTTMHRDRGSRAEAIEYARKLVALSPQDPAPRQLLAELEGGPRSP